MKRKKKHSDNNNLQIVYLFLLFVFCIIVISLLLRFFTLLKKSTFGGTHQFTVLLFPINTQSPSPADVVSFAPETMIITILEVKKPLDLKKVSNYLDIPIDARIGVATVLPDKLSSQTLMNILLQVFLGREQATSMTSIDAIRLWILGQSISNIKNSAVLEKNITGLDQDSIIAPLFINDTIAQEKVSISIINGTDVSGLGNRLAKFITNMGGNVVSIKSSDMIVSNSTIEYYGDRTYTLDRLENILHFSQSQLEKPGISDIIITIGEKQSASVPF